MLYEVITGLAAILVLVDRQGEAHDRAPVALGAYPHFTAVLEDICSPRSERTRVSYNFV